MEKKVTLQNASSMQAKSLLTPAQSFNRSRIMGLNPIASLGESLLPKVASTALEHLLPGQNKNDGNEQNNQNALQQILSSVAGK
ncbi:MAG: hypothetical protein ACTHKH_19455 [Trinickia sp.]